MARASLQINQAGLPAGDPDTSRSDGLDTGDLVTLISNDPGTTNEFTFLWVPEGDTTAVNSLVNHGDYAEFFPTPGVYGTYRIQLDVNRGTFRHSSIIRTFSIRTPNLGLRKPALGERAAETASLVNSSARFVARSENNEIGDGPFASGNYGGWYSALSEVIDAVDAMSGGGGSVVSPIVLVDPNAAEEGGGVFLTLAAAVDYANTQAGVTTIQIPIAGIVVSSGAYDFSNCVLRYASENNQGTSAGIEFTGTATVTEMPIELACRMYNNTPGVLWTPGSVDRVHVVSGYGAIVSASSYFGDLSNRGSSQLTFICKDHASLNTVWLFTSDRGGSLLSQSFLSLIMQDYSSASLVWINGDIDVALTIESEDVLFDSGSFPFDPGAYGAGLTRGSLIAYSPCRPHQTGAITSVTLASGTLAVLQFDECPVVYLASTSGPVTIQRFVGSYYFGSPTYEFRNNGSYPITLQNTAGAQFGSFQFYNQLGGNYVLGVGESVKLRAWPNASGFYEIDRARFRTFDYVLLPLNTLKQREGVYSSFADLYAAIVLDKAIFNTGGPRYRVFLGLDLTLAAQAYDFNGIEFDSTGLFTGLGGAPTITVPSGCTITCPAALRNVNLYYTGAGTMCAVAGNTKRNLHLYGESYVAVDGTAGAKAFSVAGGGTLNIFCHDASNLQTTSICNFATISASGVCNVYLKDDSFINTSSGVQNVFFTGSSSGLANVFMLGGYISNVGAKTAGFINQDALSASGFPPVKVVQSNAREYQRTVTITSATNNNFALFTAGSQKVIRFGVSGPSNPSITGIVPDGEASMSEHILLNVSVTNVILAHNSGSSSAGNRFQCFGSADITIAPNGAARIFYDHTTLSWRAHPLGGAAASTPLGGTTASRPVTPAQYTSYFDTTLGIPIWYVGVLWLNAAGVSV